MRPRVICPYCGIDDDRVIDSRSAESGAVIRRRRACNGCGRRFTTYERVEKTRRLIVIKRDGSRDPFQSEKILAGVQAACGKRPIPEATRLELVDAIEDELHREFEHEVASVEIGRRVAERLRRLDAIAYLRYASEHYEFRSLDDLLEEGQVLKANPPAAPDQGELFARP